MHPISFSAARTLRRALSVCAIVVAPAAILAAIIAAPLAAQRAGPGGPSGQITLDRLFTTPDFQEDFFGPARWFPASTAASYTTLEPSPAGGEATDIVRYDATTGARTVLVPATKLVTPGTTTPLAIEEYSWSPDGKRVLIFTNSRQVWRE